MNIQGNPQREALFRCDASPEIGLGHFLRCSALAAALQNLGYRITFALTKMGLEIASMSTSQSSVKLLSEDALFEPSTDASCFDLAVVDSYSLDDGYEEKLRSIAREVAAIDDLGRTHATDVVIDTMPLPDRGRYETTSRETLRLLGGNYALLRSEFEDEGKTWDGRGDGEVLVSIGGTDPMNATGKILRALEDISELKRVTTVLGAAAPHLSEVADWVRSRSSRFVLEVQPKSMSELYCSHSLVLGAPGISALERACCGAPQILIEVAKNQAEQSQALADLGAGLSLGHVSSLDLAALRSSVVKLLHDHEMQSQMSTAGRRTIDGMGSRRVAAILSSDLRTNAGQRLAARPLQLADRDIILEWQSHETTRRYSRNPKPPNPEQHDKFIRSLVGNRKSVFEIITENGEPRALVRAELRERFREVSIVCSPNSRGRGIGGAAIRYLKAFLHDKPLIAFVDPGNSHSINLFRNSGFEADSPSLRLAVAPMS